MGFSLPSKKKKKTTTISQTVGSTLRGRHGGSFKQNGGGATTTTSRSTLPMTASSVAATTPSPTSAYSIPPPSSPVSSSRRTTATTTTTVATTPTSTSRYDDDRTSITRRPPLSPAGLPGRVRSLASSSTTASSPPPPPPPPPPLNTGRYYNNSKSNPPPHLRVVSPSPQRLETIESTTTTATARRVAPSPPPHIKSSLTSRGGRHRSTRHRNRSTSSSRSGSVSTISSILNARGGNPKNPSGIGRGRSRSSSSSSQLVKDLYPSTNSYFDVDDDDNDDEDDDAGTQTTNYTYTSTVASSSSIVNDEPSLDTMQAGNLTNDDTSSALTSLICLSLIQPPKGNSKAKTTTASATDVEHRPPSDRHAAAAAAAAKSDNSIADSGSSSASGTTTTSTTNTTNTTTTPDAQSVSPEIITQASILRHMRFHLARRLETINREDDSGSDGRGGDDDEEDDDDDSRGTFERMFFASSASESSSDGDWSSSSESDLGLDDDDDSYHHLNPDGVHYRAQECLYRGETSEAIRIYRELLSKQRKNVHAQRADTLSRLAVLCLISGGRRCNEKAARYSTEALALHEDNVRPLQAAVSAMELGLVHFGGDRLDMALLLWRQAMQMACVSMGYDHPYVAILLNNIGVLHFKNGEYVGAMRALEEAVELQRATLRYSCSPINVENAIHQLAISMGNLAVVWDEGRQQPGRAGAFLQESLSLYESVHTFANDRMEETIADYMDRLSQSRKGGTPKNCQGSTDKSDIALRSVSIFGNSDGIPKHLSGEVIDNHDYLLLGALEPESTPEELVRRTVIEWFGKQVADDNSGDAAFVSFDKGAKEGARSKESIPVDLDGDTVVNAELHLKEINRQAMEHVDHNEIEDALDLFRGALRSHREKYGEIHHLVGSTLHNMGMIYFFTKQYNQAEKAFVEALNVRSAALGASHPEVAASKAKIGLIQLAKGDLDRAGVTFWDIREGFLDSLGHADPELAKMMNNIGVVEYCRGNLDEARRSFEIAHDYQKRRNENGETVAENESLIRARANTLNNIGFVLAKTGETAKAVEYQKNAIALYTKVMPLDDPTLTMVQGNIEVLLHTPPNSRSSGARKEKSAWSGGGGCHLTPICFSFD